MSSSTATGVIIRRAKKPTVEDIQKIFPYSAVVLHGFKVRAQDMYYETLGRSYSYWIITQWEPRGWAIEEESVWQYENGTIYCKHEKDLSILTMVMLSKPKRLTNN